MADTSQVPPNKPVGALLYRQVVWGMLLRKKARNYLEIGVQNGITLAGVEVPSIGVDPKFAFTTDPMRNKSALFLFQSTSDDFFRDHDPRALFGGPVDVAFLDGLHLFEVLLRDFINTERVCDGRSLIMLDDCLPMGVELAERDHRPEQRRDQAHAHMWCGDVWKVLDILREYRPDLRITPVAANPSGNILVSRLDPASTVLSDRYDEIVARYRDVAFTPESFEAHWVRNAPLPAEEVLRATDLERYITP